MPRNHVFVRPIRPDEAKQFIDWSLENPNNGFDPETAKFPTSFVLAAYDQTGVLAYQPVQCPYMLEGVAARPGLEKSRVAEAMKEFTQALVTQAHIKGVGEMYFLGTDEGTNTMATNHTFEELPYKVYRVKVKELEG